MEPKKLKKLVLKKETISNLSNFQQNMIIGGYGERSWDPINWCPSDRMSMCHTDLCVTCPPKVSDICIYTAPVGGGTCDSTADYNVSCTTVCW